MGIDEWFAALHLKIAPLAFTDYWPPMIGIVVATSRPPAASCTSGVYRSLGTDEWNSRCNLPPGGKLHLWQLTAYYYHQNIQGTLTVCHVASAFMRFQKVQHDIQKSVLEIVLGERVPS